MENAREGTNIYKCLFNLSADAMLLETQDGRVVECNEAALRMLGYTREEMLTLSVKDLTPAEMADTIPDFWDESNTSGGVFIWISSRKKDGTIFPTQYSTRIITLDGKKMVMTVVRDVTSLYWRKHYAHKLDDTDEGVGIRGVSYFSLTWQRRAGDFVLIGYDKKAITATQGLIKNYIGKTAARVYGDRPDLCEDFDRSYKEKALIRRKTLYKMFSTGQDRIADITFVAVPPDIVIMHIEDATDREEAETLNQSLVSSSPVGLCLVQDNHVLFVNSRFMEYAGYDQAEILGKDLAAFIHPEDVCLLKEIMDSAGREEASLRSVYNLRINGRAGHRWTIVTSACIFYRNKAAVLFNFLDCTELRQAREKLDEMALLHSSIMDAIPHAVVGLDNRRIVFANHAVNSVFGWNPEELIGKSMRLLFHSRKEYEEEGNRFYAILKHERTHSLEFTYRHRSGKDVACLTSVSRIGAGEPGNRLVATHTDITEKKHAEDRLRESQRVLSTLMGNLPGMAYRCKNDRNYTMEFVSKGSYDLTGYKSSALVGNKVVSVGELTHPEDRQMVWDSIQKALKRRRHFQITYRLVTARQKVRWVYNKGMGVYSPEGDIVAIEGFVSDITPHKLAEEQLEHSRKQLSIHAEHLHVVLEGERTEIAREIHDELGQILTVLKLDLFGLRKTLPEDNVPVQTRIGSMMQHIDATIKTVERILVQLRPGVLADLGLTSALEWLTDEFQARTGIICEAILDPTPGALITDDKVSTALYRICQEALTNILRHSHADRAEINLRMSGRNVELTISDNGVGIRKKDISKSDSFGILGIKERINLLGGKVSIVGRANKGTVLRLRIPLGVV